MGSSSRPLPAHLAAVAPGRRLIDALPLAMYICDRAGRITRFNRRAAELWGRVPAADDRYCGSLGLLREDGSVLPHAECPVADVLRTGEPVQGAEVIVERPDASRVMVRVNIVAQFDADGDIIGTVTTFQDITSRRQAEERLRAAVQMKDQFTVTLAHELRQPLAPMATAVGLLRISEEPEPRARALDVLERQIGQMQRLVDDLLDAGRLASGKIDLHRERLDLRGIVTEIAEGMAPSIEEHRLRLTVSMPPDEIVIEADVHRLRQVLSNLLTNAVKFTPEGGRIDLAVHRSATHAEIQVRDTGQGIPEGVLPHIFDLFVQTAAENGGGLGIGLAVVRRLVEAHGGTVDARSDGLDTGAEFIVRLPLSNTAEHAATAISNLPHTDAAGPRHEFAS